MDIEAQLDEATRILRLILESFHMRGNYLVTRTNEGRFVEPDEDLVAAVDEAKEFIELWS